MQEQLTPAQEAGGYKGVMLIKMVFYQKFIQWQKKIAVNKIKSINNLKKAFHL